ncbi:MAG: SGNH/GDSL hydrolase family protein [Tannerellaceae bacterium]
MKRTMLLSFFVLFLAFNGYAEVKKDSVRVLLIGNSYTYFNDLPKTIQKIAATQGVNIAYTQFTPGGAYLAGHVKNEKIIQAIKQGGWDYVIIQEQSAAPAMPTKTVIENTYPAAYTLDSLILAHSKQAKVLFYMTWGHKYGCQEEVADYPLISTYGGMQERLKTTYLEMAYQNKAWCAPVGMAWQRVRNERPDYQLYEADCSHPSSLGSYLAANVIFSTIYRQPYQTQETMGIPSEQAEYIQQVAQQTVLNNLRLLNIKE